MQPDPNCYSPHVTIRPAMLEDLKGITEIIHTVACEEPFIGLDPQLINKRSTSAMLLSLINCSDALLLLAVKNKVITGLVCAAPGDITDTGILSIGICVLPQYRNRGVGSLLMKSLIKWCRETKKQELCLSVLEHNTKAIKLYRKFGFSPSEKNEPSFIRDSYHQKAIIMNKII